jgi:hypothetical protein
LLSSSTLSSLSFRGMRGATYQFQLRATNGIGLSSPWSTTTVKL